MSEAHGVDPLLVRALIQVESNYKPEGEVPTGAMGLMQLMPSTAKEYNVRNPFDPRANIEAGHQAPEVAASTGGASRSRWRPTTPARGPSTKFNGIPPYRETRDYVTRILALAGLK